MRFPTRAAFRSAALLLALAALPTEAVPAGNLTRLVPRKEKIELQTDQGVRLEINLLSARMLRIQAGPEGKLQPEGSRSASIVVKRDFDRVDYRLEDKGEYQLVQTSGMALRIHGQPLRFALYAADNRTKLWEELQPLELSGERTFQTLDSNAGERFFGGGQQNGSFEFKGRIMEISYSGGWEEGDRPSPAPFYMSTRGYGVLRNTWSNGSYDFRSSEFITLSHDEARFDAWYFVGDLGQVLADYTELTGRARLIPRWAFEYGDADCYNDRDNADKPGTVPEGWSDGPTGTTPDVIDSVARKYREHDMPGGWILPNDGYGCGYTDLPGVVRGLAKYGFHTGLWTENGVEKIAWEVGTAGTRAQKLDVAWTGEGYQFALDANQAAADGILENSDSRPFLWTVMGWAGIQRYAVTWTGDQSSSWDYIRWHIPTLIGSGLSGQVYATGDVDAIFGGSPETYTRDLQWKSFTPVLMGMSGWSKSARKHPWWYDEPYRGINRRYLKLKMRLMPYMYTAAYEAETTGAPIIRGLMWDHRDDPHANTEAYKYQFFVGRDLLVAPVYRSMATNRGWREDVYLPRGRWIDYWDGRVVDAPEGGRTLDYQVSLEIIPVFVRAGAILPMYPASLYDGEKPKDVLTLDIYPHGHSSYTLYEDDGNTRLYRKGKFSRQAFEVTAPEGGVGDVTLRVGPVQGDYAGQEQNRAYELILHTRVRPDEVSLDGGPLPMLSDAEYAGGEVGWTFSDSQYGTIFVRTEKVAIRRPLEVRVKFDSAVQPTETPGYKEAPEAGDAIAADGILVLNRPAEEPGHPLENAFDDDPGTWFRTRRDQRQKTGAHEFVLALGARAMVNGFEIAPRNDKYWKYGQVRDYEVHIADSNGEWGAPAHTGRLALSQERQRIEFEARPGSLFRFRVLSTQDPAEADPMVTAAAEDKGDEPYDALQPRPVSPITISEFRVLQQAPPDGEKQQVFLSDVTPLRSENALGPVEMNKANGGAASGDGSGMSMDGLKLRRGMGVSGESRIDYSLSGNWQLFRADLGIDDSCRGNGVVRFQVFGDDRLLYDSGLVQAPSVIKAELDIRGIRLLSLRTTGGGAGVCANWAEASVIGFEGDKIGE